MRPRWPARPGPGCGTRNSGRPAPASPAPTRPADRGPGSAPRPCTGQSSPRSVPRSLTPPRPASGPAETPRPASHSTGGRSARCSRRCPGHRWWNRPSTPPAARNRTPPPPHRRPDCQPSRRPGRRPHRTACAADRPPTGSWPGPGWRCSAGATAGPARHPPNRPDRGPRRAAAGPGGGDTARRPACSSPGRSRSCGPGTATTPARSTPPAAPATTGDEPPGCRSPPPPDPPVPAETSWSTPPPTPDQAASPPVTPPPTRHAPPRDHPDRRSPDTAPAPACHRSDQLKARPLGSDPAARGAGGNRDRSRILSACALRGLRTGNVPRAELAFLTRPRRCGGSSARARSPVIFTAAGNNSRLHLLASCSA